MDGEDQSRPGGIVVLQGTLETLALPELLSLLAQSRKTGALWLDAANSSAVVYIVDGRCCAAESSDAGEPLTNAPALLARVVDICFAVERTDDGAFRFGPEEAPWACAETVDLEVAIDELGRLVAEWREIQAVIPSLECRIRLADELGVTELTVDHERWQLIVAIDGRRTVRDLAKKTGRGVLDVCHAILALVDAGAVNVGPPPAVPVFVENSPLPHPPRRKLPATRQRQDAQKLPTWFSVFNRIQDSGHRGTVGLRSTGCGCEISVVPRAIGKAELMQV